MSTSLIKGKTLSKASIYETMFGTRHRGPGRPNDTDDTEPLFPTGNTHVLLADVAMRRAYAVVHEENKARLREVFTKELKVLERRGVEQVAVDSNRDLNAARWGGSGSAA
jgi:hypothetical protein